MPQNQGWEVNEGNPVDGFSTSTLKQVVIHNFGPSDVGIRIDGQDKGELGQTDATYPLPTNGGQKTVLVEVLLLPGTHRSRGEFRF